MGYCAAVVLLPVYRNIKIFQHTCTSEGRKDKEGASRNSPGWFLGIAREHPQNTVPVTIRGNRGIPTFFPPFDNSKSIVRRAGGCGKSHNLSTASEGVKTFPRSSQKSFHVRVLLSVRQFWIQKPPASITWPRGRFPIVYILINMMLVCCSECIVCNKTFGFNHLR